MGRGRGLMRCACAADLLIGVGCKAHVVKCKVLTPIADERVRLVLGSARHVLVCWARRRQARRNGRRAVRSNSGCMLAPFFNLNKIMIS